MTDRQSLLDLDRNHHVHGQTNLRQHQTQGPAAMVTSGHGVYITTDDGHQLIDGFSGLGCTSLGYHNERLSNAAKQQMDTLPFAPTFYGRSHPKVAELAARLVKMTAVPMDRVMFQCSGIDDAGDRAGSRARYGCASTTNALRCGHCLGDAGCPAVFLPLWTSLVSVPAIS